MATATLASVLQQIRTIANARAYEQTSDRDLLEYFLAQREEAAFVALLKRHGPMVMQVCRRIQGNEHDAEDVFQATFLLLARKAGSISRPESLASWLHGVAHRLALEAKNQRMRRQAYERRAADMRSTSSDSDETGRDLHRILDEALRQVPEKYRVPLLLCYLQGKTQEEAARQLGCPLGTLRSRLARGRDRLKEVLERQGVHLSATALAAGLAESTGSAAVPPILLYATARAALAHAAGKAAVALVSVRAAALVEAGLKAMLTANLKITTILILAVGTLGLGAGAVATRVLADPDQRTALARSGEAKEPRLDPGKQAAPSLTEESQKAAESGSPADPNAGEPAEVRGQVLDPDGKPVPGAKVTYQQKQFRGEPAALYPGPVSGNTDGDGRFRISVTVRGRTPSRPFNPIGTLTAVAPRYTPVAIHLGKPEDFKEFTLRLPKDDVPIEGRIIDLEGKPVAGVSVRLLNFRTNVAGNAGNLQPWLDAIRDKRDLPHDGYLGVFFTAAQAGLDRTTVTDAAGRFQLTGAGRDRIVALRLDGPTIESQFLFVMTRLEKTFRVGDERYWHPNGPDLIHGARFEHAVAPATRVEGVVRDMATGRPIAGATVRCKIDVPYDWDKEYIAATTDAAGRYRLMGRPRQSPYWILAIPPVGEPYLAGMQLPPQPAPGQVAKLDFGLKRGVFVRGRVTDKATGKPIQAEVQYFALADNPFLQGIQGYLHSVTISSKVDGSYKLVGLPGSGIVAAKFDDSSRGRYINSPRAERIKGYDAKRCGFACNGDFISKWNYDALAGIEPIEGTELLTCDLQFDAGKTMTGTCTGPDGRPLAGVSIRGTVGRWTDIRDLPTPQFTLNALDPEKPEPFFFYHREKKLATALVVKGDEPDGFTVQLQSAATVTGRLIDEDGIPLDGRGIAGDVLPGQLNLSQAWGILFYSKTDKDGRFRMEGIVPGVRVDAHIDRSSKPLNNSLIGDVVFDQLTLKPGEVRDLGDIRVNDPK